MSKPELNEDLITRIANGDSEAIYNATKSIVYGFALSILKNREDAEDVMHDAYIKMYNAAAGYIPKGKPLAWLLTIVKHLAYNKIRDFHQCDDIDELDVKDNRTDYSATEDKLVIDIALKCLTQDEAKIVILHSISGLKHREIAEVLDMSLSAVLSRYNRAIKKIRKSFGEKGISDE